MLSKEGISAEVINLRSIRPLYRAAIKAYVRKTNRLVVLEEGSPQHRVGAEIWLSLSLSLSTHIMLGLSRPTLLQLFIRIYRFSNYKKEEFDKLERDMLS